MDVNKLKTITLYEQVATHVKELILVGRYQKGDLLPSEKMLMDMTGVSRITVREALRNLSELGIIQTIKGKGSVVLVGKEELVLHNEAKVGYLQYKNQYLAVEKTRILIEPEFAKEAARMATPEGIARIEACLEQDITTTKGDSAPQVFHRAIVESLENPIALALFDKLEEMEKSEQPLALVQPYRQKTVATVIETQHRNIFNAIANRDAEFAYFYMKEHATYLYHMYADYFDNFK